MLTAVTPVEVEKALRQAPAEYRRMHEMNAHKPIVAGCKLGAVFLWEGAYHIYVGVNGRNRKMPVIAYRVSDWSLRKMGFSFFDRVRKASE